MTRTLRHPIFVMTIAVLAAMWFAAAAQAGAPIFSPIPVPRPTPACDTRLLIVAKLGEKYGEVQRGGGLSGPTDQTVIYEVWASNVTGTWTILRTTPDGFTCLVAVGDGWHDNSLRGLTGDWL